MPPKQKRKTFANTKLNRAAGVAGKSYTPSTNSSSGRKRKRSESSSVVSSSEANRRLAAQIQNTQHLVNPDMPPYPPGDYFDMYWMLKDNEPDNQRYALSTALRCYEGEDMKRPKEAMRILRHIDGISRNTPAMTRGGNGASLLYPVSYLAEQPGKAGAQWLPMLKKLTADEVYMRTKLMECVDYVTNNGGNPATKALFLEHVADHEKELNEYGPFNERPSRYTAVERGADRDMARMSKAKTSAYISRNVVVPGKYRDARATWDMAGIPAIAFDDYRARKFARMWESERDIEKQYIDALPLPNDIRGLVTVGTMYGPEKRYVDLPPPFKAIWMHTDQ